MSQTIKVEILDDLALLRLSHGVTNAISRLMVDDLRAALADIRTWARCLVLAGGEKFFSIGFNLPELLELDRAGMREYFYGFNQAAYELFSLPMPTVCAIQGHAVAGGAILAMTCDFRVASTGRVMMGLNEVALGVPVPLLTDLTVRQLAGDAVGRRLLLQGEMNKAEDLVALGLVDSCLDQSEVEAAARNLALKLAALPAGAYSEAKDIRIHDIRRRFDQNHEERHQRFLDLWFSPETQELLRRAATKF